MKRRYVVSGNLGVVDPETGDTVASGGVVTLDSSGNWAQSLVEAGVIELEADRKTAVTAAIPCPLCEERGEKKVPAFAEGADLAAHYTEHHPGFVVPAWKGGE